MTKTLFAAPIIAAILLAVPAFAALPPASAPKPAATSKAKPAHAHHHKKTDEVKKPA